jgi:hypothetical protein
MFLQGKDSEWQIVYLWDRNALSRTVVRAGWDALTLENKKILQGI